MQLHGRALAQHVGVESLVLQQTKTSKSELSY
jgi:hypothetical protein